MSLDKRGAELKSKSHFLRILDNRMYKYAFLSVPYHTRNYLDYIILANKKTTGKQLIISNCDNLYNTVGRTVSNHLGSKQNTHDCVKCWVMGSLFTLLQANVQIDQKLFTRWAQYTCWLMTLDDVAQIVYYSSINGSKTAIHGTCYNDEIAKNYIFDEVT